MLMMQALQQVRLATWPGKHAKPAQHTLDLTCCACDLRYPACPAVQRPTYLKARKLTFLTFHHAAHHDPVLATMGPLPLHMQTRPRPQHVP